MEGPPTKRQKRQQCIVLSSDDEDAAADGGGPAGASACADDAALARRLQEREEMKARLASEEAATKRFLERDRARQHGPTAGPGLANGGSTHSGAAAHRNSIAVAVRAPPASARWVGQLDPKHTDPQPLPGQTLTYRQKDWPPHKWEVRTSDEIFTPFEVPAALAQAEVEVYRHKTRGQVLGVVLRDVDGEQGRSLARSMQGVYGSHVLGGRGTNNNCSNALGETCSDNGDKFRKIWPIRGEAAGGNHDGDTDWDRAVQALASAAIRTAGMPRDFPFLRSDTRGSVQILRFRAASGMPATLKPTKRMADGGDRIHMHVDRDPLIDTVMLMALGNTARFSREHTARLVAPSDRSPNYVKSALAYLTCDSGWVCAVDLGACCRRTCLAKEGTKCVHVGSYGQVRSKDICVCNPFGQFRRRDWHRTGCASCVELELRSGDLLLFKGNPAHDVAHGALDTVADTGPEDMPTWAQGCRVSMQYRVRMPTGPPARGWKQTGGGH